MDLASRTSVSECKRAAEGEANDSELSVNSQLLFDDNYNYLVTVTQNDKTRTIEDLYMVMRYVSKSKGIVLSKSHLLEMKRDGCLHIHCFAKIANRKVLFKKNNIVVRLKQKHEGYYIHFNNLKDESHIDNCLGYYKNKTHEQVCREYIIQGYAEGYFNRCPYHNTECCEDFSINEAFVYYYYSVIKKLVY